MAKKVSPSKIRAVLGDKVADKIGTYDESTGGGTPIPKGEKLKDHPEAKRVQQPRDEEGKFTYNAVNNKPLKYPSRGETIPPFLKDVNLDKFAVKGKVTVIHNGNRYTTILDGDVEAFIRNFQVYDKDKGFGEWSKELSKKRGKTSKAEKEALNAGKDTIVGGEKIKGLRMSNEILQKTFNSTYAENFGGPYEGNKVGRMKKELIRPVGPQPTPQPKEQPNPTPQPKQQENTPKEFDTNLAKTNPMEFAKQNKDTISKIMNDNPDLSPTKIISLIANGYIKASDV